jgi:drug/metabolite transporter (DMT)-like permease
MQGVKVDTFAVIVVNYCIAALPGIFLTSSSAFVFSALVFAPWFPLAIIIGFLFIVMFYLIALSVQKAGLSVSTIANRMSLVIPITFSILFYRESLGILKSTGIILALFAVLFTVWKKRNKNFKWQYIFLPLSLFLGGGLIDTLVKYTQHAYLSKDVLPVFSVLLFGIAAVLGLLISILRIKTWKYLIQGKVLIIGFLLGLFNFGSFYFFVNALSFSGLESSNIFGINHVAIVALSILTALVFFREKLSTINWLGVILALISIFLLTLT